MIKIIAAAFFSLLLFLPSCAADKQQDTPKKVEQNTKDDARQDTGQKAEWQKKMDEFQKRRDQRVQELKKEQEESSSKQK